MPGMNSGLNIDAPALAVAFRSALLHQGLIALLIFAALGVAWIGLRARTAARSGDVPAGPGPAGRGVADRGVAEPAGRQLLLIGFGNLWLFDGFLKAQPGMPGGLTAQVIRPEAVSSPAWVQHIVTWGVTSWAYHPVAASAAAVWIEVGLGLWLLAAPHGSMSRLAGLASAGWGLAVWVFGDAFGGIFTSGQSWLTGAPGASAIYVVAGVLIALPGRAWAPPRLGRLALAGLGLFLTGMAVLQAWPGRGFWQGISSHGRLGSLSGMALSMAVLPQPGFLSGWVAGFATFDEAHGFAVNLLAVAGLAVVGAAFLSGRPRIIRPVLIGFTVASLAIWVLIQDLGFLGGVGTDPNSMIPFILLASAGSLALTRAPAVAGAAAPALAGTQPALTGAAPAGAGAAPAAGGAASAAAGAAAVSQAAAVSRRRSTWRSRLRPAALSQQAVNASVRSLVAVGAVGLIILGAVPLAVAQASPNAGPIAAQPVAGRSAPGGQPATPASQRYAGNGRAVESTESPDDGGPGPASSADPSAPDAAAPACGPGEACGSGGEPAVSCLSRFGRRRGWS